MTFEEFNEAVQAIAMRLLVDGFQPDAIVAITRGGWIPARLLSKHLGVKRMHALGVTYGDASRRALVSYDKPDPELKGQRLLLVEDFLESGKSIKVCLDQLIAAGNDVKTFAVGYQQKSVIVPDYTQGLVAAIPKLPWD